MTFLWLWLGCATALAGSPLDAPEVTGALPSKKAIEKACGAGDTASCWFLDKAPSPLKAAVLQGPSTNSVVRLSAWSDKPLQWSFVDMAGRRRVVAERFLRHGREEEPDEVLEYRFTKLKAGREYRAFAFDPNGTFVDGRRFRVLAPKAKMLRVAVAACMDDRYDDEQKKMWPQLVADMPDALLLLGDNTYATRNRAGAPTDADPEQLWHRQRETREKLELYRQERLLPTFAVWDDHDYGMRDGDGSFPHKEAARDIHRAFFATGPRSGDSLVTGPGVSLAFDIGSYRFVLADDRTFRKTGDVWGVEQTEWILARVAEAKKLAFVANGHQFLGAYHRFESFERYAPDALKAFLAKLGKAKASVILLSGDRHLIELQALEPALLGYPSWELTTSAIHAKTYPDAWKDSPNPRQKQGKSGAPNYAIVVLTPREVRFLARGLGGATFFDEKVSIPRQ